jgi:hypothetical protein
LRLASGAKAGDSAVVSRRYAFAGAVAASLLAGAALAQPADTFSGAVQPQRPGVVDAYVVVAALDSDQVFNREAREAGRVLAQRFDASGRTITLAANEGEDRTHGIGSPGTLAQALDRVAATMDKSEDVLVLYTTSHGSPRAGLNYRDVARGAAVISPEALAGLLARNGFQKKLVILQACYSGQFVPALASPQSVVATAASATRSSFGCTASNDWTFFGHALINQAMRQPDTFARQFRRAFVSIYGWEKKLGIAPSDPQVSIGADTDWLAALDARASKSAGAPTGNPPSEIPN